MANEEYTSKRFPANTKMETLTFLNDKKINGELYAYLQGLSVYEKVGFSKSEQVDYYYYVGK